MTEPQDTTSQETVIPPLPEHLDYEVPVINLPDVYRRILTSLPRSVEARYLPGGCFNILITEEEYGPAVKALLDAELIEVHEFADKCNSDQCREYRLTRKGYSLLQVANVSREYHDGLKWFDRQRAEK